MKRKEGQKQNPKIVAGETEVGPGNRKQEVMRERFVEGWKKRKKNKT